jgi:hypothetical protein
MNSYVRMVIMQLADAQLLLHRTSLFVSLCEIVSRPQGTKNKESGKITTSKLTTPKTTERSENARAGRTMCGWSDMMREPAPGSLSGYQLYNMHN